MANQTSGRRNLAVWILAVLTAFFTASCGGRNPVVNSPSPQLSHLQLNTGALDFGSVSVGSSKSNTITLTNPSPAGAPGITVSQASATGSGFSLSAPALPLSLAAGQTSSLTVIFTPNAPGAARGQLSIMTQGSNQSAVVALSGVGLGTAQLAVSPSSLNFGSVGVGSNQSQTGTLTTGGSNVTISSANLNGQGFSLSGISFPTTIAPGNSLPFTVDFAPLAVGTSSGQLSFFSDASNSPIVINMSGSGFQSSSHNVTLSWNASTSVVMGYNIYRSTQSAGPYARLNSSLLTILTYTDNYVQSGSTYYYAATAVDSSNVESTFSNVATAVIP